LVGGFVLFLVGSIAIDTLVDSGRLDSVTNTAIPGVNGGPDVRAYVAKPEGDGPFPTVIMIHEFFGLNESIVSKADLLAQEGYLVIAPDTFRGSTTAWIPRAIYQVITTKQENINADLDSVYAWLESQSDVAQDRVGVAGFCYGGRASLLYSLHNNKLAATVIFYGSSETDPAVLKNLPGPVLGIFGGADQSIPLTEVDAFEKGLEAAGIPNQITVYEVSRMPLCRMPRGFNRAVRRRMRGMRCSCSWNRISKAGRHRTSKVLQWITMRLLPGNIMSCWCTSTPLGRRAICIDPGSSFVSARGSTLADLT